MKIHIKPFRINLLILVVLFLSQAACSLFSFADNSRDIGSESAVQVDDLVSAPEPGDQAQPNVDNQEGVGLTRDNPYPFGELVTSVPGWHFRVVDLLRGQAAYEVINSGYRQFDVPTDGYEYVLAKLFVRRTARAERPGEIGYYGIGITGSHNLVYLDYEVRWPQPEIIYVDMYTSETMETWIDAIIPVGEDNLLVFINIEDDDTNQRHVRYLALEPGASVSVVSEAPGLGRPDLGVSLQTPAMPGERVTMENWEITLLNAIYGEAAIDFIHQLQPYFALPDEGMVYLVTQFQLSYYHSEDMPFMVNYENFQVLDREGTNLSTERVKRIKSYQVKWLNQFTVLSGAQVEGWVLFLIPDGTNTGVVMVDFNETSWGPEEGLIRYYQFGN